MARKKSIYYQYSNQADNVIEDGKPLYKTIKGKWNEVYFKNNNPIVLELACGKGEYTVGLARLFPDKNFIGIDIKGDRIARGSMEANESNLKNVAFLRAGIKYLHEFFVENEVDEIWLVHPDPKVRQREENQRLTNQNFLTYYATYLKDNGIFHLKTDSPFLYDYSLSSIQEAEQYQIIQYTSDLYHSELYENHYGITTHYEKIFVEKGYTINYIKAQIKKQTP
ncbi:tRNA (guanosine(46)-N7)-methyltransferase TrmB [Telluribacter humicola]|uniref:tRNA (guanosine(46)-N7)-methyltransferase TrmB n=1 Tax=Telluribacter humicola TaxID=1720261 RepID=UPI001A9687F1|nr:tRNA (guanosine(46)-N7)-methyltransferase TrmB [Telluribacter humicola]